RGSEWESGCEQSGHGCHDACVRWIAFGRDGDLEQFGEWDVYGNLRLERAQRFHWEHRVTGDERRDRDVQHACTGECGDDNDHDYIDPEQFKLRQSFLQGEQSERGGEWESGCEQL